MICDDCIHKNICYLQEVCTDGEIEEIIQEGCSDFIPYNIQKNKCGHWIFHKRTKLVPTNKVGIKEEYTNGHNCTIVDDKNVNRKIMIMKKRITLKIPICSVCGWCGYDEYNATNYCPNCGARMEEFENQAKDIRYNPSWGHLEINMSLVVVGKDFWLERHEYDGSEWWEFKTLPIKPDKKVDELAIFE